MVRRVLGLTVVLLSFSNLACMTRPAGGTLDNVEALPDADGDGFPELPTPDGVDDAEQVAVEIINEITRAQAEAYVAEVAGMTIPGFVTISIPIAVTLSYIGGEEITHTGTESLQPFEIRAEAACPEMVTASVRVIANIPIVGMQTVFMQEFPLSLSEPGAGGFQCETVISVRAFLDPDTGAPNAEVQINEQ